MTRAWASFPEVVAGLGQAELQRAMQDRQVERRLGRWHPVLVRVESGVSPMKSVLVLCWLFSWDQGGERRAGGALRESTGRWEGSLKELLSMVLALPFTHLCPPPPSPINLAPDSFPDTP